MNLTREQAIKNHRKLWNWIADETERLERKVSKDEYFYKMGIEERPLNGCYCCECTIKCDIYKTISSAIACGPICLVQWSPENDCINCGYKDSPYTKWLNSKTYEEAAKYAREIANLPEMEGSK